MHPVDKRLQFKPLSRYTSAYVVSIDGSPVGRVRRTTGTTMWEYSGKVCMGWVGGWSTRRSAALMLLRERGVR
jgi:hypothetical protein